MLLAILNTQGRLQRATKSFEKKIPINPIKQRNTASILGHEKSILTLLSGKFT